MVNQWTKKDVEFLHEKCFKNRVTTCEKAIVNVLKNIPDLRIVDIGCGTGRLLDILKSEGIKEFQYLGLDFSEEMLSKAKIEHPENKFKNMYFLEAETEDFIPNVLICLDVIQHQNTPIDFLNSLRALNIKHTFIEGWFSEKGTGWSKSDKIVKLETGNEFYENIYDRVAMEYFSAITGYQYTIFDADTPETFVLYDSNKSEYLDLKYLPPVKDDTFSTLQAPKIEIDPDKPDDLLRIVKNIDLRTQKKGK